MSVIRGNSHEYLVITLDYTVNGQVSITMISYIEEILAAIFKADPKEVNTNSIAAPNNLFMFNEYCKKLSQKEVVELHNLVTKTLYATKRSRPDTCTAIVFLTTRVRAPDKYNWENLVHLV